MVDYVILNTLTIVAKANSVPIKIKIQQLPKAFDLT